MCPRESLCECVLGRNAVFHTWVVFTANARVITEPALVAWICIKTAFFKEFVFSPLPAFQKLSDHALDGRCLFGTKIGAEKKLAVHFIHAMRCPLSFVNIPVPQNKWRRGLNRRSLLQRESIER